MQRVLFSVAIVSEPHVSLTASDQCTVNCNEGITLLERNGKLPHPVGL